MRNRLILCVTLVAVAIIQNAGQAADSSRPNVIVFIADDVSWNDYGCYGNSAARTPNIDRLAAGGIRFDRAYLTASSCSPSRSSIITGRYPHNNGKAAELHLPISVNLPWFPELLREAGYYTALSGKNHMTTTKPQAGQSPRPKAFDLIDAGRGKGNSGGHANWVRITEKRPQDRPFFFWFASYDAHRAWDGDGQWDEILYGPKHDPKDIIVPPFLSDDPDTRQDLASYYNEVTRFDHYIGEVTATLQRQGALDNTLIFVLADNGRPFPRAKTRLHDSGMKTGLVAHWPQGIKSAGSACSSLVSVIDLAPTILGAAGVEPAETMQGVSLAPIFEDVAAQPRRIAFSEHNWHDYEALGRSVRKDNFLFVRNWRPGQPWQGPADSVRSPSFTQLKKRRDAKELSAAQADVFLAPRPEVELYRIDQDPDQLTNLAGKPEFAAVQKELATLLDKWRDETGDSDPGDISRDSFDRETGERIVKGEGYRGTTPGEDRHADQINAPGPR
ncbi:sulfatase-like hydrolase/transferase [bacterium]|nr:sulfatase-like hydrolase/transferase [bacterium]